MAMATGLMARNLRAVAHQNLRLRLSAGARATVGMGMGMGVGVAMGTAPAKADVDSLPEGTGEFEQGSIHQCACAHLGGAPAP